MRQEEGYLERDDYRLFYQTWGRGFPILLLHNATGSALFMNHSATWRLGQWLAEQQYQVIVFDQHGFGKSSPQKALRLDFFQKNAEDAVALLDHLKISQVVVLGVGEGGTIALNLAIKYPERVLAVVADSAGYYVTEAMLEADADPDNAPPPAWQQLWEEAHGDKAEPLSESRTNLLRALAEQKIDLCQAQLSEIKCPTLLMACTGDIYQLSGQNKEMGQLIPYAIVKIFRGGDHPVMWNLTPQFEQELGNFLTQTLKVRGEE